MDAAAEAVPDVPPFTFPDAVPEEDVAEGMVPDVAPFAFADTVPEEDVAAGAVPGVLPFVFPDAVAEEEEGDGVPGEDSLLQPDSEKQKKSRNAAMKDSKKVEFLRDLGIKVSF